MEYIYSIISIDTLKLLARIVLYLISAFLISYILRSFIKIPKSYENRRSRTYIIALRKFITTAVYIAAFYFIFSDLGINLTPLLASASIIGIIVGFGARALVEDLINGFFLLTQDSLAIGDYVKLDEAEGNIEKLGFRTITIRGDSGELYIIPNGQVKKIINFSRIKSNVNVDLLVKADQEIDMILKAMEDALLDLKKDPSIKDFVLEGTRVVGITEFKVDGRIIVRARITTAIEERFKIARKYMYLAKKNFEKNKIELC